VSVRRLGGILVALCVALTASCAGRTPPRPTAAEAEAFLKYVNATLLRLSTETSQAAWVYETYITGDTEALNARANQIYADTLAGFVKDATRFDDVDLPPDERRQLDLLKLSPELVPPSVKVLSAELARLGSSLSAYYLLGWEGDSWLIKFLLQINNSKLQNFVRSMKKSARRPLLVKSSN
jgi:peptidyl-dipeptidase A